MKVKSRTAFLFCQIYFKPAMNGTIFFKVRIKQYEK
ncbi:MAG: hypothetical protein ACI9WL_001577, partial [Rubritalea sp.]